MKKYKFKTKPFKHQSKALDESWSARYYALFMEMGTGKSKVAIDTMGILYTDGRINAALIISPKKLPVVDLLCFIISTFLSDSYVFP